MVARRQSKIRQAIYEAVVTHPVHPTAEYIYEYPVSYTHLTVPQWIWTSRR